MHLRVAELYPGHEVFVEGQHVETRGRQIFGKLAKEDR